MLLKKQTLVGILLLVIGWVLVPDMAHAQSGPVGWWKLDEGAGSSAADASGNGAIATLLNSPTWSTGRVGPYAITFAGSTQAVTTGGAGSLGNVYTSGMTVSAWINPSAAPSSFKARIVDKDNASVGWFLAMNSTRNIEFWGDEFASAVVKRVSSGTVPLSGWKHVVATWDGSTTAANIHIYLDGVLADGTATNGSGAASDDSGTPLTIGNRADLANAFTGAIDDVRVHSRVLTSSEIQALADSTAPSTPSGLTAIATSSSQINLSWTASTDNVAVTGYRIERCQGASCTTFAQIGTPSTTSYSDTGLTAGTSYSYRVRATDANSNLSTYSTTASATTSSAGGDTTAPTAPSGLTATVVSSTQINLSWTTSTDNIGVTGYKVERCQGASCTTFAQISTPTTTSYSDTGLAASTSYTYRVRATDAANNLSTYSSSASATTSAAPDTTPPTAPSGLTATAVSSSQINLSWTASTDNVGVTGYKVERCQGASCTTFAQIGSPSATSYSDTGLAASTSYSYQVRATDAAGNLSTYSSTATATTASGGAGPIAWWRLDEGTGTTAADASGNGSTGTLQNSPAWSTGRVGPGALTFNGGAQAVSSGGAGTLANLHTSGMTVSAWINATAVSSSYKARIVDKDNASVGWFLALDNTRNIEFWVDQFSSIVKRVSSGAVTLSAWKHVAVTWDGSTTGANIHIYIDGVLSDGTATNGSGVASDDSGTPLTIGNRGDLVNGFTGAIDEVRVYNRVLSATEIQALTDTTAPSAPTGLTATASSSSQINLSWTASTDNIGVTGYRVESCQGASCTTFAQIGTPTTTTFSATGLTASTAYNFRVRATDAVGNLGTYSGTAGATTQGTADSSPPSAPTGLTATAVSSTQINLSWAASTDNVGVTGYVVESCQGTNCTTFAPIATPTTTTFSATGLTASTTYSFRVRASDAAGNLSTYSGAASATTQSTADTTPPTAPTGLTATAVSSVQINLSWAASTDNVAVTGYVVESCQGTNCTTFAPIATPTTTTYTVTGLAVSTAYSFRVRATDAASNLSSYSNTATATTQAAGSICD